MHTYRGTGIRGKRVLVRVDFNVPIAKGGVGDDFRIRAHAPLIRDLLRTGNTVILLSHHSDNRQTLRPLLPVLKRVLGIEPVFFPHPSGGHTRGAKLVLVENLRRSTGEQKDDPKFAKALAAMGEVYINDAFSVAHRKGASLTGLPKLLPSYMGPLFSRELEELDRVVKSPKRPLVAVFGGAKVETKLRLLQRFSRVADAVLVGGSLANEILNASGTAIRLSRVPSPSLRRSVYALSKIPSIRLPVDLVSPVGTSGKKTVSVREFPKHAFAYDIGPRTVNEFERTIAKARTIVWNGPLGFSEDKRFRAGTDGVVRAIKASRARSVIGGGDTIAFLGPRGLLGFDYVSTGGGAMLSYLSGEKLPALEALKKAPIIKKQ